MQETNEVLPSGARKEITIYLKNKATDPKASTNYNNNQCISDIGYNPGKLSIKQMTRGKIFTYPSSFTSASLAVNYYLMAVRKDSQNSGEKSNLALTLKDDNNNVNFQTFTGAKNQTWNIKRVGTGAGSHFHITNAATGYALECNTETINDLDAEGDIIAKSIKI